MIEKLNEDEKILVKIIGEKLFLEVREEMGGFQIYIQRAVKPVSVQDVKKLMQQGKSKRAICRELQISYSRYNDLIRKSIKK